MEDEVDKIEEGELKWVDAVRDFYGPFKGDLDNAEKNMPNAKAGVETEESCPECGSLLKERWGRFGKAARVTAGCTDRVLWSPPRAPRLAPARVLPRKPGTGGARRRGGPGQRTGA
jgi:ssDNA-binding Zn-finger/Zn-ribbon topoisomerase 1